MLFDWRVVRPRFLYSRKDLGQADLADIFSKFVKSTEKFLEAFFQKFNLKNEKEMKLKMVLEYSDKTLFFELKFFFSRLLETFLCALRIWSRYLQGSPDLALYVSKKSGWHDTPKNLIDKKKVRENFRKIYVLRKVMFTLSFVQKKKIDRVGQTNT